MKKLFTIIALAAFVFNTYAFTDEWKCSTEGKSPVTLDHITATFQGTWEFKKDYAVGTEEDNGQQVIFTPTASGNLTIIFGGEVNTGKKLHMQDADENGLTAQLYSNRSVTIDDNTNPPANIATGDGVVYALQAGKTYTFSVSGTKWRLASFKYSDEAEIVYDTEWNFSRWADEDNGFSNQVKDNLGLLACYKNVEKQITNFAKINASKKGSYTKRLQTGGGGAPLEGTGTPTQRFLYFNVNGNANIIVEFVSGSSDENRDLIISDGTNILSTTSGGSSLTQAKATYTGGAGVIYIYGSNAINIYDIKANNVGTTVQLDDATKPTAGIGAITVDQNSANAPVYNVAGQKVGQNYKGVVIQNGKKFVNK